MVKKNQIVGSFNGISSTCKLEMEFFFHNSGIIAVCHVYITQSSPFHVTHDMSSKREFCCSLHVSVSVWE